MVYLVFGIGVSVLIVDWIYIYVGLCMSSKVYVGCFVFLFFGLLYVGLLVVVLVSYLDVCVYNGCWLLCIEDIDEICIVFGVVDDIIVILVVLDMYFDGLILVQSQCKLCYQFVCDCLGVLIYFCGCSCKEIVDFRVGMVSDGVVFYFGICCYGLVFGKMLCMLWLCVFDVGQQGELV